MRPRDLTRLATTTYDVLVVGGGIYGLTIAYEAASRGLATALVERGDFGGGASFNHQKTVHGGLRSLQSGSLRQARESIVERRALARIAPWLLRPLPFIIGTHRSLTRSRLALRAAFRIDRWLGRDRNDGVEPELHLPPPRLLSKAAALRFFPGIRQDKLTGAAQWYDYQMVEADRLTLAFAAAADRAGADLANYVEAVAPIRSGSSVAGMTARDALSGNDLAIQARTIVNAAGAHAGAIMAGLGVKRAVPLLKAMNLVTSKPASDIALVAPGASGRMLTLVPWRGHALVGTAQSPSLVAASDTGVTAAEVETFIADANRAFPALRLGPADVTLVHRGVVPAAEGAKGAPELRSQPAIYDHTSEGAPGAFTVIGVKYTTARRVAERTTDLVARRLKKRIAQSRTATTVLPGAGIADHEALAIETARASGIDLSMAEIRHLIGRYAERAADIVRLMRDHPELRGAVSTAGPTLRAEVVYVIRHEMALHLTDIIVRRTGAGAAGRPDDETIRAMAEIAARELEWDIARTDEEIAAVERVYALDA
ncbi:MAG TPA: FAD-dependent oxidoreductase [Vicinamibacterales bacterium]|nr:FAD-dependent oxidoreductase [Vicinamibacterales bacterium]